MKTKPEKAESILRGLLKRMGLLAGVSRHSIIERWPEIVEATVARHVKAERISGSTLFVAVDSSVWMNEMVAMKQLLIDKVNASLAPGASPFTEIRLVQRSWAASPAPRPAPPEPAPPGPTEPELRIRDRLLEPVRDKALREVLRRLWEKDRQLKWRRGIKASTQPEKPARE